MPAASTSNLEDQVIFGQGFRPLTIDKSISNYRAAVLVLVHPRYFISPVPTISGERSPIGHLGRRPMETSNVGGRSTSSAAMITRTLEPDQWRNREEWCLVSGRRRQLLKNRTDRFLGTCYIIEYSHSHHT